MADGRFAPSPTGELHIGNLRTALVAWLAARSTGGRFLVRMEDLDAGSVRPEHRAAQLRDLALLGLDHDGPVTDQHDRLELYAGALTALTASGLTYPCYCTRREIRAEIEQSARAAHGTPPGAYPGTCRSLGTAARAAREAEGRRPAVRLRAPDAATVTVHDTIAGTFTGVVDDMVLARADGTPAYNLAVVVDDADQGVEEVVRGDDLLPSTPRQVHLAHLLSLAVPTYTHVPLVLGSDGRRLAKRHGAVTLTDLAKSGRDAISVRSWLAESLGLGVVGEEPTLDELVARYDPAVLPREPWTPPLPPA